MADDDDDDFLPPPNLNTFAVPNDPRILREYELFKPTKATRGLLSERHRELYGEVFIENPRLGTLSDLAVRALAMQGTRRIAPVVQQNPLKLRIHYDSLDVNMPLKDCYFVEDLSFWRRVVLAKSSDLVLSFRKLDEFDWRGMGISLKYVELVEACPAEYWPEKKMAELGGLVKDYVKVMHIKHLQSLSESSFKNFTAAEPELDVSSMESVELSVSSDSSDTIFELEEEEVEEEGGEEPSTSHLKLTKSVIINTMSTKGRITLETTETGVDPEADEKRRKSRWARNDARQILRDLKEERRFERRKRKEIRDELRERPPPPPKIKRSKKKPKPISGVFDMAVEEEPDDGDDKILDNRNKRMLVESLKAYDYPAKHCHHIDLSFVRYFDQLNSLTLEFLGPRLERDYHQRHRNFSYLDMERLARGLRTLKQLKILRIRNSRMDNFKLILLVRGLHNLDQLEEVDLGYDGLYDDCSDALRLLLHRKKMLKSLQLEYNQLGSEAMAAIGRALKSNYNHDRDGTALRFLGLAYNPVATEGLNVLFTQIQETHHVEELNINGILGEPMNIAKDVGFLLRHHKPLRRLDMTSINFGPTLGHGLISALERNLKVVHVDCRGCDLSFEQEYEADIIVRRNNFCVANPYVGDVTQTESKILKFMSSRRHPIMVKMENDAARLADCIQNRPLLMTSESSAEELIVEEEEEPELEAEFDIWKALGVQETATREKSIESSVVSQKNPQQFVFDANAFNLEEIRLHLDMARPRDRYRYFQEQLHSRDKQQE